MLFLYFISIIITKKKVTLINYTPPYYKFITNSADQFQVEVEFSPECVQSMESLLINEAEKSSLFAVAFIQKLAMDGNNQAIHLTSLYQAYHLFMETGDKSIFASSCEKICQNNQTDLIAKDCANYILSLIKNQAIDVSLKNAETLITHLIPHLKQTLALKRPELIYASQEVIIPEITAKHLAFPDLIKFEGNYYACFREADSHVAFQDFGKIRILKGNFNGKKWDFEDAGLISKEGFDLRDPRFFIDHHNTLRMIMGGSKINEKDETTEMVPHVATLTNKTWQILEAKADATGKGPNGQWIWRVTWNPLDNHGYALSYGQNKTLSLMKTSDGLEYTKIADIGHEPLTDLSEATIRFKANGEAIALIRARRNGIIAVASPNDYTKWTYETVPFRVGGQDFHFSNNEEKMWAATRHYFLNEDNTLDESTIIASMNKQALIPALRIKSHLDNSYPSMVMEPDGSATVIYYSSETENISRIYITRVTLPD